MAMRRSTSTPAITKTFTTGLGVDVGLLYYYYPGGDPTASTPTFFEPYASVTYTIGPVAAKLGAAYAWGDQIGPRTSPPASDDNIYVYGEASVDCDPAHLPLTLKSHLGYTNGSLGLVNQNGADDTYYDWSVTAGSGEGPRSRSGVSYVDTERDQQFRRLQPVVLAAMQPDLATSASRSDPTRERRGCAAPAF